MAVKVGINGFGRIGRIALRIMSEQPEDFDVCGINLRKADLEQMVYLFKYDTTFRRFNGTVETDGENLIVNGKKIKVFSCDKADDIMWKDCGAEYILEATGAYLTADKAQAHFNGGAKKVVMSAPAKDETPLFVYGVNEEIYSKGMKIVSSASCTTNCLAPLAKVLQTKFGIEEGLMSTIHASTSKQKTVDDRGSSDWRSCRSVYGNIIPSSTGAAKAVGKVIPSLKGKLTGMSFRVPTADASVVDLTVRLAKNTTYEEICAAVKEASETYLKDVIEYTNDMLVSTDIIGNSHPCVFDEKAGIMLNDHFVKLVAWYDNEWGYTSNLCRFMKHMAKVDAE